MNEEYKWLAESFRDTLAGILGGTAAVYSTQPLDTIKVKMQTSPRQHSSILQTLSQTFKREGMRGLYAGSTPAVIANISDTAVTFLAYGRISSWVQEMSGCQNHQDLPLLSRALCGAGSGVFASFVLTPSELVKCRLQTGYVTKETGYVTKETGYVTKESGYVTKETGYVTKNTGHVTKETGLLISPTKKRAGAPLTPTAMFLHIATKEGPGRLMRGWTTTLLRKVWSSFFFFGGYEGGKMVLLNSPEEVSLWKTAVAGGVGGTLSWGLSYPIDVVKSRVQVGVLSPWSTVRDIYSELGLRGFFRGITPCLIRAFPGCGALFVAVDFTKLTFNKVVFEVY
ncbi:hypothetical protein ACHWQZ_G000230 [Mnemiopsis leidyi]